MERQGIEVSGPDWMPRWWKAYKKEYNCDESVLIRGSGIMFWMSQDQQGLHMQVPWNSANYFILGLR